MNIKVFYSEEDECFVAICDREGWEYVSALGETEEEAVREFSVVMGLIGVEKK